jgi:hypothetical protein
MSQTIPNASPVKRKFLRLPLMALAIGALIAGLWAAFLRIGW